MRDVTRQGSVCRSCARRSARHVRVAVHLGVRPGKRLREIGQRIGAIDRERRRPAIAARARKGGLSGFHDNQRQPGTQPIVGLRAGRCQTPGQVRLIEFDDREVVALGVEDVGARPGADDAAGIESAKLARAEQIERHRCGHGLGVERDGNRHARPRRALPSLSCTGIWVATPRRSQDRNPYCATTVLTREPPPRRPARPATGPVLQGVPPDAGRARHARRPCCLARRGRCACSDQRCSRPRTARLRARPGSSRRQAARRASDCWP